MYFPSCPAVSNPPCPNSVQAEVKNNLKAAVAVSNGQQAVLADRADAERLVTPNTVPREARVDDVVAELLRLLVVSTECSDTYTLPAHVVSVHTVASRHVDLHAARSPSRTHRPSSAILLLFSPAANVFFPSHTALSSPQSAQRSRRRKYCVRAARVPNRRARRPEHPRGSRPIRC